MTSTDIFCAQTSQEVSEQLFGTSNHVDVWLLLEYNLPWAKKAYEQSDLTQAVREWMDMQLATLPNARVQFIKAEPSAYLTFYVAVAHETQPLLYKFSLNHYEDLLTLDLPAIIAGQVVPPVDEKLFLVCTHGKRDRCCALFGLPIYNAMRAYAGETVWQTTHTGGHRFAATLFCFPHGLGYGRVLPGDVRVVVDSYHAGQLLTEFYRGRSCYSGPVQVAEYFVRQQSGLADLDALRLLKVQQQGETTTVEFTVAGSSVHHEVQLIREDAPWLRSSSCGKAPEAALQYRLLAVRTF